MEANSVARPVGAVDGIDTGSTSAPASLALQQRDPCLGLAVDDVARSLVACWWWGP